MDRIQFNTFCQSFPNATHIVQWGGADVWKIGGKVFAIGGWNRVDCFSVVFKTSEIGFEILRQIPGCAPAPYLASRGLSWIQSLDLIGLNNEELQQRIAESYDSVARSLTKKVRAELGIRDTALTPHQGAGTVRKK